MFGLRSSIIAGKSEATALENRPVYSAPVYAQISMDAYKRTHEYEDVINLFLPAIDHLVVLVLCGVGVYGEE